MKKVVRLTENDIERIVLTILNEQTITDKSQLKLNSWYKLKNTDGKEYRIVLTKIEPTFMVGSCYDSSNKKLGSGREMYLDNGKLSFNLDLKNGGSIDIVGPIEPFESNTNQTTTVNQQMTANSNGKTLNTSKDVQFFQNWLDSKYPTWYRGGKLGRGRGWGQFGPYTRAAWNKHKNEYSG